MWNCIHTVGRNIGNFSRADVIDKRDVCILKAFPGKLSISAQNYNSFGHCDFLKCPHPCEPWVLVDRFQNRSMGF